METRSLKPYIVILVLMALTSLSLAFSVDVTVTDEAGIRVMLPDQAGAWQGTEVRYCVNEECQQTVLVDGNGQPQRCPTCGSELSTMGLSERLLLPADTVILKKEYAHPSGRKAYASIVLSGKERASIHRPEVCLVGQGRQIVNDETMLIDMPSRDPLEVMLLNLQHTRMTEKGEMRWGSYYAYWFVGKGRETPSHLQRMIWMASDRIFHNVSHRWAYIAIAGVRDQDSEEHKAEIKELVGQLYPQIALPVEETAAL